MPIKIGNTELKKILCGEVQLAKVQVRQNESSDWVVVFEGTGISGGSIQVPWEDIANLYQEYIMTGEEENYLHILSELSHHCIPLMKQQYIAFTPTAGGTDELLIDHSGALSLNLDTLNAWMGRTVNDSTLNLDFQVQVAEELENLTLGDLFCGLRSDPVLANLKQFTLLPLYRLDTNSTSETFRQYVPSEVVNEVIWSEENILTITLSNEFKFQNTADVDASCYANWFSVYKQYLTKYEVYTKSFLPAYSEFKSFRAANHTFAQFLESVETLDSLTLVLTFNPDFAANQLQKAVSQALSYVVPIPETALELPIDDLVATTELAEWASGPLSLDSYQVEGGSSGTIIMTSNSNYPTQTVNEIILHVNTTFYNSSESLTLNQIRYLLDAGADLILRNSTYTPILQVADHGYNLGVSESGYNTVYFLTAEQLEWQDNTRNIYVRGHSVAEGINDMLKRSSSSSTDAGLMDIMQTAVGMDNVYNFVDDGIAMLPTPMISSTSQYTGYDWSHHIPTDDGTELDLDLEVQIFDSNEMWPNSDFYVILTQILQLYGPSSTFNLRASSTPYVDDFTENKTYIVPYFYDTNELIPDLYFLTNKYKTFTNTDTWCNSEMREPSFTINI